MNIVERVKQLTERALERRTTDRAPRIDPHLEAQAATLVGVDITPREPDLAELTRANSVLSAAGVRVMELDGVPTIGVWSDLDGPEVRTALCTFGLGGLPVRCLDGGGIPLRYKPRGVEGEPVPTSVLAEMERNPADPWKTRDRMLNKMGWRSNRIA
jgi:hypothetical protein